MTREQSKSQVKRIIRSGSGKDIARAMRDHFREFIKAPSEVESAVVELSSPIDGLFR